MRAPTESTALQARIAELLMGNLVGPCDLRDGNVEVVHDVESVEIEMDCDLDESKELELVDPTDDCRTHQFVRCSAPYERIEIELDLLATTNVAPKPTVRAAEVQVPDLTAYLRCLEANVLRFAPDTVPFAPYEPTDL